MNTDGIRPGFTTVTPYMHGTDKLIDFMKAAFAAEELDCYRDASGRLMHAEMRMGESMVEVGDPGDAQKTKLSALHLYVPDVDAVYRRAVDAGATSLMAPTDMPYGDREGDLKDQFGNYWYIATHQGSSYIRENLRAVTACPRVADVQGLIEFCKQTFQAEEILRMGPYSQVRIGDAVIEPGEATADFPAIASALHCYVSDVDATYQRALSAGAKSLTEPKDMEYGERNSGVEDQFGLVWYIAKWL